MQHRPIIVLTAGGINPTVMIYHLAQHFSNLHVFFEKPESKIEILKRRRRHVGLINAIGQMATMVLSRLGKRLAEKRSDEIIQSFGLKRTIPETVTAHHVETINGHDFVQKVAALNPAVIFTISCRLLTAETLSQMTCPIINFHAGINPNYRGQMGGYWSLVEKNPKDFGATVHLVDSGVDTGARLYEQRLKPAKNDTIATYPLLLTAGSVGIATQAIEDALSGSLSPKRPRNGPSKLRFPPTIWAYLYHGVTKGVW